MAEVKEIIYETPDVPEAYEEPKEEKFDDAENIERVHLNVDEAMKKFAGRFISADNVDFTGLSTRRRPKGYSTGHYVIEYVGPQYDEPETIDQRYNRLLMEAEELQAQIASKESTTPDVAVNKSHLDYLTKQLEKIDIAVAAGKAPSPASDSDTASATSADGHAVTPAALARYEARLSKLERALGTSSDQSIGIPEPIYTAIDSLNLRLDAMDPIKMDSCLTKLNEVLAQNKALEKKDGTNAVLDRIDEVYKTAVTLSENTPVLEAVVQRLRSLAQLHEQLSDSSARISELRTGKTQIMQAIDSNLKGLAELKSEFTSTTASLRAELATIKK
uniref:Dynactin subunit 2 n=1 Tax=Panagrellus redivivus TaxID=6233 RepID=A0A7E4VK43_PANRE